MGRRTVDENGVLRCDELRCAHRHVQRVGHARLRGRARLEWRARHALHVKGATSNRLVYTTLR